MFHLSFTSFLYAVLAWLSLLYGDGIHLLFAGMVIASIAAGSVITVVSIFHFFVIYVIIQMSGLISAFLYSNQEIFYISAILAITFSVFVISNGYKQYSSIKEMLRLHGQINDLLDNAGQGFLSFDNNLICESSFSAECKKIFDLKDIEGLDISQLLFSQNIKDKELFCEGIESAVKCEDKMIKDMFLSLIPKEQIINNNSINIECKALNNNKFMIILTDITKTKILKSKVEHQTHVQNMIVEVASNKNDFIELKDAFNNFVKNLSSYKDVSTSEIDSIRRELHTFKGVFAQKKMIYIPSCIHEIELKIRNISLNSEIISAIIEANLQDEFNKDIAVVNSILGEEFLNSKKAISVEIESINEIESELTSISSILEYSEQKNLNNILTKIKKLKYESVKNMLDPYISHVKQLSLKLEKEVYELEIEGDSTIRVSTKIKPFMTSLIHLFNNCVDHGIEDIDTRADLDKDDIGTIKCKFEVIYDVLAIQISDDGQGIDTNKLSLNAIYKAFNSEEYIALMSEEEKCSLIFTNKLSTKDQTSIVSGFGTGMSSIKDNLEKINGTYSIKNEPGDGVTFSFFIPLNEDKNTDFSYFNKCENICDCISEQIGIFMNETLNIEVINTKELTNQIFENKYVQAELYGSFNGKVIIVFSKKITNLLTSTLIPDGFNEQDKQCLIQELPCEILNTVVGLSIQHFDKNLENTNLSTPINYDNFSLMNLGEKCKNKFIREIETSYGRIICIVLEKENQ
ncbi:hypothetical protein HUE87_09780 [Candidatus Sulfurimonas marisnigri]|uniref:histidine kinase n=1 Tax=Candidatus Sulfurimonas marisnigri TaxID=2740405 RepID=A0A7S7RQ76_9BACT|nr:ATP-binding protein [Candidatus Sulfurimonas marisnigri]QOY54165.1 hypothetical protein HUE87_09780 [Candidatus Sulfurimonas marisnigri]